MVIGENPVENVRFLADRVRHVEIVLFHTEALHNLPTDEELEALREIGRLRNLTYSVHLPASLDFAHPDGTEREKALVLAENICRRMVSLSPELFVLHLPVLRPVLVATPGDYLRDLEPAEERRWQARAVVALERLNELEGLPGRLLVENINYSPRFIEPFLERKLCGLCLDIGHLLLGAEEVTSVLKQHLPVTREIHLHGVSGNEEHIDLSVLPAAELRRWVAMLCRGFSGILTLEVFSEQDFLISLDCLRDVVADQADATRHGAFHGSGC